MSKKMKMISVAVVFSFILGCGAIKQAKTTPETIEAFKSANTGVWLSECTQLLNVNDPTSKDSAQILVQFNTDSTAVVQVVNYSGVSDCKKTTTAGATTSAEKTEYNYVYSNLETVFSDSASMKFISQPQNTLEPKIILSIRIKTQNLSKDQVIAQVELISGSVARAGVEKEIPQSVVKKAKLKFSKSIL